MNERQRIMVVDDNQDMLKCLNRTLELEGFDTVIVDDTDSTTCASIQTFPLS
jgi:DNA-binding NtrC family response regulator